jgi:hypothetical protein
VASKRVPNWRPAVPERHRVADDLAEPLAVAAAEQDTSTVWRR